MEPGLQQCVTQPGRKVEVLNFGVSGFSTVRELILLRQRVWQYDPDIVLLLVTTGNDVGDNSTRLNQYPDAPLPYYVFRNGQLTLDDSRLQAREHSLGFRLQQGVPGRSLDWLRDHLRLVGLIDSAREAYRAPPQKKPTLSTAEPGMWTDVFRPPMNADWEEAWKITEALIVQIRDEVKAKGAKFLVVTGSTGVQVSPDASLRKAHMKQIGLDTLFYPDFRIKALGDRNGFEVLNLAPPLLDYAARNQVFLHGSGAGKGTGHWNETGHQVVSGLVAERLCRMGL
jgi:hypothetical protein